MTNLMAKYAGPAMIFCALMFMVDLFLIGFVSVSAPAMVPMLTYSAGLFVLGAFVNAVVVLANTKKR